MNFRDITQFTSASSDFSTTSYGASLEYGMPITELQSVSLGLAFNSAELLSSTNSTRQAQEWVANNGNPFLTDVYGWRGIFRYGVLCN